MWFYNLSRHCFQIQTIERMATHCERTNYWLVAYLAGIFSSFRKPSVLLYWKGYVHDSGIDKDGTSFTVCIIYHSILLKRVKFIPPSVPSLICVPQAGLAGRLSHGTLWYMIHTYSSSTTGFPYTALSSLSNLCLRIWRPCKAGSNEGPPTRSWGPTFPGLPVILIKLECRHLQCESVHATRYEPTIKRIEIQLGNDQGGFPASLPVASGLGNLTSNNKEGWVHWLTSSSKWVGEPD